MNGQDFDLAKVVVVAEQVAHQHLADWHDAGGREVRIGELLQRLAAGGYARRESRAGVGRNIRHGGMLGLKMSRTPGDEPSFTILMTWRRAGRSGQ